ncbi:MAG: DUF4040 domain-containing protein [Pseudohongiellaceae bacterium]
MTLFVYLLDILLALSLLLVAMRLLAQEQLYKAVALFVVFGLIMTLVWVRLDATDIALAEAGIGAGFTGALLIAAVARLRRLDARDQGSDVKESTQ